MKSSFNAVDELDKYIFRNETTSSSPNLKTSKCVGMHKTLILPVLSFPKIEDFIEELKLVEAVRRLHFQILRGDIEAEFDIEKLDSSVASNDNERLPPPLPFSMPQIDSSGSGVQASNKNPSHDNDH